MRKHYERILRQRKPRAAPWYPDFWTRTAPFCGGFPKADSLAGPTAITAPDNDGLHLNPESHYCLDAKLGRRLALARWLLCAAPSGRQLH